MMDTEQCAAYELPNHQVFPRNWRGQKKKSSTSFTEQGLKSNPTFHNEAKTRFQHHPTLEPKKHKSKQKQKANAATDGKQ
jgi:hypothetical protein